MHSSRIKDLHIGTKVIWEGENKTVDGIKIDRVFGIPAVQFLEDCDTLKDVDNRQWYSTERLEISLVQPAKLTTMSYEQTNWLDHKPETFEFNGKWIKNWFSNMIPSPIFMDGSEWEWPSVENYYQAMKSDLLELQEAIKNVSPSRAKQLGKQITVRPNWAILKEGFMKRALMAKFSHSPWYEALMATGEDMIIEWNNWGDTYWGVTLDGKGSNRLGILLMEIRDSYKKASDGNNNT